jgi:hypothetical protein
MHRLFRFGGNNIVWLRHARFNGAREYHGIAVAGEIGVACPWMLTVAMDTIPRIAIEIDVCERTIFTP